MLTVKLLRTPELIEDAAALLYQVYIEELQWQFAIDNPSKLRVEVHNGRKLLLDRFTDSATWFGAFNDKQLIGCMRLTMVDENNQFELEAYPSSKIVHDYLLNLKNGAGVELTKIAVQGKYAGQGVVKRMWLAAFKYCQASNYSVICCTHNGYLKNIFKRIGFPLKLEHAFKYEPSDPLPVNVYLAYAEAGDVTNMIYALECLDGDLSTNSSKIFKALELVAPILPVSTYWHDVDGVVLGINEHCLNRIGSAREDIVGKSPYEFYPEHTAEHIVSHNNQVIRSGEVMTQEEWIKDITTGQTKCFSSTKAPLYDDEGNIIGVIGSFVEVTSEKESARLRLENERHKVEHQLHERFRDVVAQVYHDIRSPLASLEVLTEMCAGMLPEDERNSFRRATTRITDIANNMLNYFKFNNSENDFIKTNIHHKTLIAAELLEVISEKRNEYKDSYIEILQHISNEANFAFIDLNSESFKRMISNIMNNAIDALRDKTPDDSPVINIYLELIDNTIKITIQDNGKGMPNDVRQKILSNVTVTEGKANGHGIGFSQIRDALADNNGALDIESVAGVGTKIILSFPKVTVPDWLADKITLHINDLIVILDDDTSIHGAWDLRLGHVAPNLPRHHFEFGKDAIDFLNNLNEFDKSRVVLLTDYELLNQGLNGLDVVTNTKIKRSILVTSHHTNPLVLEQASSTNTKILPKQLAVAIPIHVLDEPFNDKVTNNSTAKVVDMVIVDDDKDLTTNITTILFKNKTIDVYNTANEFLDNISNYPKDTKILIDNHFNNEIIKGIEINKKLYENGYTHCYLYSGSEFNRNELPDYMKVILKTDIEAVKKLLSSFAD